jgi:hypothetical protein
MKSFSLLKPLIFLLSALCILFASAHVFAAGTVAKSVAGPDILVLVNARTPVAQNVAISFPKIIPGARLEELLTSISRQTGWNPSSPEIASDNGMSSVTFQIPEVNANGWVLPVANLITACKEYRNMKLVFLVPPGSAVQAPDNYQDRYVSIDAVHDAGTYAYTVAVKDTSFVSLNLPVAKPSTLPTAEPVNKPSPMKIISAVFLAAVVATGVFILVRALTHKNG